jgi:hypothetical protein
LSKELAQTSAEFLDLEADKYNRRLKLVERAIEKAQAP